MIVYFHFNATTLTYYSFVRILYLSSINNHVSLYKRHNNIFYYVWAARKTLGKARAVAAVESVAHIGPQRQQALRRRSHYTSSPVRHAISTSCRKQGGKLHCITFHVMPNLSLAHSSLVLGQGIYFIPSSTREENYNSTMSTLKS